MFVFMCFWTHNTCILRNRDLTLLNRLNNLATVFLCSFEHLKNVIISQNKQQDQYRPDKNNVATVNKSLCMEMAVRFFSVTDRKQQLKVTYHVKHFMHNSNLRNKRMLC